MAEGIIGEKNFIVLLKDETVKSDYELVKAIKNIKRLISEMKPPKVFIFFEKGYRLGKLKELLKMLLPLKDVVRSNEPKKLFIGIDNEALPIEDIMEMIN